MFRSFLKILSDNCSIQNACALLKSWTSLSRCVLQLGELWLHSSLVHQQHICYKDTKRLLISVVYKCFPLLLPAWAPLMPSFTTYSSDCFSWMQSISDTGPSGHFAGVCLAVAAVWLKTLINWTWKGRNGNFTPPVSEILFSLTYCTPHLLLSF